MSDITTSQRLRDSIRTGEILTIIYSAGSHSGELRQIVPIQMIEGDEKVRARCLIDGITKNFSIDKISIVDEDGVITHSAKFEPAKNYNDIKQLHDDLIILLAGKALHINHTDKSLSIHKVWKTGTPQKGCIISISFYEFTGGGIYFDEHGGVTETEGKLSARPWYIDGGKHSNSFKYFDKAAHYFLEILPKVIII